MQGTDPGITSSFTGLYTQSVSHRKDIEMKHQCREGRTQVSVPVDEEGSNFKINLFCVCSVCTCIHVPGCSCAFLCAFAHILCMHVCGVGQRSMFYHLPPYIVRQGFLLDPEITSSMLWSASSRDPSVFPPSARIIGMCLMPHLSYGLLIFKRGFT